jgi:hypothetical protein
MTSCAHAELTNAITAAEKRATFIGILLCLKAYTVQRRLLARIVHQLRQRLLVDLMETIGELCVGIAAWGKTGTISLAKRADEGVAVLAADLTVLVAVAIIEAGLLHCV